MIIGLQINAKVMESSSLLQAKIFDQKFNEREMFIESMPEIKKALPQLSKVRSCAMLGCGYGHLDLEFVDGCLRNLTRIAAVDPDPEHLAEFKIRVEQLLPTVTVRFFEETAQSWKGDNKPFDAVLLFEVLYFIPPAERPALFKKIFSKFVASGGFVFIYTYPTLASNPTTSFGRVIGRLGVPAFEDTDVATIRDMMKTAGFSLLYEIPIDAELNVQEPADEFFSLYSLWSEGKFSVEDVRRVFEDEFDEDKICKFTVRFLAFKKPESTCSLV